MLISNTLKLMGGEAAHKMRELLIESFDSADRIYVETSGSDTTGDGSKANPFQTLDHAVSQASAGKALIIGSGTFQVTPHTMDSVRSILGNQFDGMTVIGTPNETIIQSSYVFPGTTSVRPSFVGSGDVSTKFYFLIVERDNGGGVNNYNTMLVSNSHDVAALGVAYNCVFKELNGNGNISISYNNSNNSDFYLHNCTFVANNWLSPNTGSGGITITNSAFTSTPNLGSATISNNIDNVSLNDLQHIQENAGVYSGISKWAEDKPAREVLIDSFPKSDRIYVETTGSDTTGDGSAGNPYQTYNYARSQASSGDIIIVGNGTFDVDYSADGSVWGESMFASNNNGITTLGNGTSTKLVGTNPIGQRDRNIFGTTQAGSKFINCVIQRDNGGRTVNYECAIFKWPYKTPTQPLTVDVINCVIEELNANGKASLIYASNANSKVLLSNSFLIVSDFMSSSTGTEHITVKNTACITTADYGSATVSNNVNGITLDGDYRITNGSTNNESHLYWRLVCNDRLTDPWFEIAEMKFYDASDNLVSPTGMSSNSQNGYTILPSSELSGYPGYKALDGATGGTGRWVHASGEAEPHFLGIQFPEPVNVHRFEMAPHSSWAAAHLALEYSDDGITWHQKWARDSLLTGWASRTLRSFIVAVGDTLQGVYSGVYSWHGYSIRQSKIESFPESNRIYVETTGSDTNTGAVDSPYLTLDHAFSQASPGDVIIIGPGSYTKTVDYYSNSWPAHVNSVFGHDTNGISVIGSGKDITQIIGTGYYTGTASYYNWFFSCTDENGHRPLFWGLTIERDNQGETQNYRTALQGNFTAGSGDYDSTNFDVENCVLIETNPNGTASMAYNNANDGSVTYRNCSFLISAWASSYSGGGTVSVTDSLFSSTPNYGGASQTGSRENIRFGLDYAYAEQYGVYSGFYGWNGWLNKPDEFESMYAIDGIIPSIRTDLSVSIDFADNNLSGVVTGSMMRHETGGPNNGPYIEKWSGASSYKGILHTTVSASSVNSSTGRTFFVWVRSTNTNNKINNYQAAVIMNGWDSGSHHASWGLSQGKPHITNGGSEDFDVDLLVADGEWHLMCFQAVTSATWNIWIDGIKYGPFTKSNNPQYITMRGMGVGRNGDPTETPDFGEYALYADQPLAEPDIMQVFAAANFYS